MDKVEVSKCVVDSLRDELYGMWSMNGIIGMKFEDGMKCESEEEKEVLLDYIGRLEDERYRLLNEVKGN